ncbi:hypothetical protein [Methanobrevibacter sp.]|uniref:hypothetical protein n=1 Tax=Methanobrevibacter sp. TaxID=66852 RepID=UPI0025E85905|nr:hypothetical protein [Methanobrevibacter sp.]MBR4447199.1 hypothetical protein [Methanobrevibacter sp.]
MERKISTDHRPSLVFEDWDSAVEAARKINIQYFDILLIEFNGEIIGYGIYNPFRERFLEKEDRLVKKSLGQL